MSNQFIIPFTPGVDGLDEIFFNSTWIPSIGRFPVSPAAAYFFQLFLYVVFAWWIKFLANQKILGKIIIELKIEIQFIPAKSMDRKRLVLFPLNIKLSPNLGY